MRRIKIRVSSPEVKRRIWLDLIVRIFLYPTSRSRKLTAPPIVVDPNEALASSKPVERYVDLPESLKNLGKKSSADVGKSTKRSEVEVDVTKIREKHETDKKNSA
jgi:hypothetical protein